MIMGLLSFFASGFGSKPRWNGTPEMFLAMVLFMQKKNNPQEDLHEVLQWGAVFQKVIKVKLAPYKDFPDLLMNGIPDYSMVEEIEKKYIEINQRIELKKAIYGENVDLGDDDIMTSDSEAAISTRNLLKDLSKYVKFRDDDQENPNNEA